MGEEIKLSFWNNQNLFSNNYLRYRLQETELWKTRKERASGVFETIRGSYESIKPLKLGTGEEAELENKFIQPVLSALGYVYHVQPVARRGLKKKRPDYALFKDGDSYKTARSQKDDHRWFFSQALTILEVKHWGRRLNDTDKNDLLDSRDPTAQTVKYLDDVNFHTNGKINWAILTNGKNWRIFYYRAASRSGNFYEVDLEEIIASGDVEKFLYFYLFFSRDAFVADPVTGKTWLDQHLKGTEEYAARVSTKLKDLIFDKVFEGLAEGFVHYRRHELSIESETGDSKREIFKGCLTLLYRLLFLLYAESRNLLPVNGGAYKNVSLLKLKQDIYEDLSSMGIGKLSKRSYSYWSRLESLCDIIAQGDPALNVPIYNGGLFETTKESFLSIHKLPDPFLAEAVELLTVDHEGKYPPDSIPFIDYSSLNVRNLGDIYEGLLEFHVQIAEEDVGEVREKGKSLWKKLSQIEEGARPHRGKIKGEVYIENSRHERKATGSYYTPHYIVEYIVNNTVGPVIDERLKTVGALMTQLEDFTKALRKQKSTSGIQGYRAKLRETEDSIFNTLFDIKVLDPAMGSGHFLVHTVDFISDRFVSFLSNYPENPVIRKIAELKKEILGEIARQGVRIDEGKLTEVNLIKRMVMKRCIYGVDLNDMAVELAKLSLWLDSFTLGAPLSFLDHHLKCGNSLIGTNIEEIEKALAGHLFAINLEPLKRAIRDMLFVSDLPDATVAQVRESYEKFGDVNRGLEGYRILLDMLIAEHFGIPDAKKLLVSDFDRIDLNRLWDSIKLLPEKDQETIGRVKRISDEKRFFHWEVEFPEVFFEQKSEFGQKVDKKENPGFDCVIGNPPYGLVPEKNVIKNTFPATSRNFDIYSAFIEQGHHLSRKLGLQSYIVPISWQTGTTFESLRNLLLENNRFQKLINLPYDVFKDAYIDTGIFVLQKRTGEKTLRPVSVYEFPKYSETDDLSAINYSIINQLSWQNNEQKKILLNEKVLSLTSKLYNSKLARLGVQTESVRGVLAKPDDISISKKKAMESFFDGEMFRYEMTEPDKFILYSDNLIEYPTDFTFFTGPRVLVRRLVSRQDRLMAHAVADTFVNKKDIYIFKPKGVLSPRYLLALLNSKLISYIYLGSDVVAQKDDFRQTTLEGIRNLPVPNISFTTPEQERKERVDEAIALYQNYMVVLKKAYEKKKSASSYDKTLEGEPDSGRKEADLSGEHPRTGKRVHGVRRRARKLEDAERISEDIERYRSTTRFIESSLGIKSYSELAPYLAKGVERVMAQLLHLKPEELKVTPEFICNLHKEAFGELFPLWAGKYRDRNVTVSAHAPPPYFEVAVLMRQYCEDLESRLSVTGEKPPVTDILLETLSFAEGRLLSIHPFLDFNGRVARMLLFALLYRLDLPPVQLLPDEGNEKEKVEYLKALSEADYFNWQPLMAMWKKRFGLNT
jgi:fido (protein-threonine AMPylation protein)